MSCGANFLNLEICVQICFLADLHSGSQSLCRNPRLGNFKRCKGIAIVRRGGWRVYRGARGNTIHPHLKIDIFKEINYKKRSKIVKKKLNQIQKVNYPLLSPLNCQRPGQILHPGSCRSWEERKVFASFLDCFLIFGNFHFLSTLDHFLLLNLPVWAIMGNPLNMSAIMFTITPPCSDMYWRCTERRNIQKLFLDCHLLLTWGMFQLDWSQWQHSSPEEFYCSRYVFTFKLTFNVISAAGEGNWPVQRCFTGLWKLVFTSPIVHKEVQPPKLFQCCWD